MLLILLDINVTLNSNFKNIDWIDKFIDKLNECNKIFEYLKTLSVTKIIQDDPTILDKNQEGFPLAPKTEITSTSIYQHFSKFGRTNHWPRSLKYLSLGKFQNLYCIQLQLKMKRHFNIAIFMPVKQFATALRPSKVCDSPQPDVSMRYWSNSSQLPRDLRTFAKVHNQTCPCDAGQRVRNCPQTFERVRQSTTRRVQAMLVKQFETALRPSNLCDSPQPDEFM